MAMMNFYESTIRSDPRFHSTTRVADPLLLEPLTRTAVVAIVRDAAAQGIDLMIFETYRSQERQQQLFAQGATKLRAVGVHHYGLAADLVVRVAGEPTWKVDYAFLGPLARAHGLVSGLDWGEPQVKHKFVDADHVQRVRVQDQPQLFAGTWYPDDAFYPTNQDRDA